jgi:hypothetical protein
MLAQVESIKATKSRVCVSTVIYRLLTDCFFTNTHGKIVVVDSRMSVRYLCGIDSGISLCLKLLGGSRENQNITKSTVCV